MNFVEVMVKCVSGFVVDSSDWEFFIFVIIVMGFIIFICGGGVSVLNVCVICLFCYLFV